MNMNQRTYNECIAFFPTELDVDIHRRMFSNRYDAMQYTKAENLD